MATRKDENFTNDKLMSGRQEKLIKRATVVTIVLIKLSSHVASHLRARWQIETVKIIFIFVRNIFRYFIVVWSEEIKSTRTQMAYDERKYSRMNDD